MLLSILLACAPDEGQPTEGLMGSRTTTSGTTQTPAPTSPPATGTPTSEATPLTWEDVAGAWVVAQRDLSDGHALLDGNERLENLTLTEPGEGPNWLPLVGQLADGLLSGPPTQGDGLWVTLDATRPRLTLTDGDGIASAYDVTQGTDTLTLVVDTTFGPPADDSVRIVLERQTPPAAAGSWRGLSQTEGASTWPFGCEQIVFGWVWSEYTLDVDAGGRTAGTWEEAIYEDGYYKDAPCSGPTVIEASSAFVGIWREPAWGQVQEWRWEANPGMFGVGPTWLAYTAKVLPDHVELVATDCLPEAVCDAGLAFAIERLE